MFPVDLITLILTFITYYFFNACLPHLSLASLRLGNLFTIVFAQPHLTLPFQNICNGFVWYKDSLSGMFLIKASCKGNSLSRVEDCKGDCHHFAVYTCCCSWSADLPLWYEAAAGPGACDIGSNTAFTGFSCNQNQRQQNFQDFTLSLWDSRLIFIFPSCLTAVWTSSSSLKHSDRLCMSYWFCFLVKPLWDGEDRSFPS